MRRRLTLTLENELELRRLREVTLDGALIDGATESVAVSLGKGRRQPNHDPDTDDAFAAGVSLGLKR